MIVKDVLIIGAGISGCATALALAKKGISVTIVTSSSDQRLYHAPFIQHEQLEIKMAELQQGVKELVSCMRATEQFTAFARKSVEELLESHYLIDRNGNVDIHRCLQEQLKLLPQVEWISNHTLVELLTLHQHSTRKADVYKNPTCIGVSLYCHETQTLERIFTKEVILATGGGASLYPYSTHPRASRGEGIAMAWRSGARLLRMDQIQFHPLGFFEKNKPGFPLPIELLEEGGQIYVFQNAPSDIIYPEGDLNHQFYELMVRNRVDHLWLNLTMLDHEALKEKYPSLDAYCLNHGYNIAKDPLPIAPLARYTAGGIATDRVGQTNVQRLRAIGEAACTGLIYDFNDEALTVLESLTWALACADDIAKHLSKFIYYFPEIRDWTLALHSEGADVEEDWGLLQHVMWNYVGIQRDEDRLKRGLALLEQLKRFNAVDTGGPVSMDQIHLNYSIQTAILIAKSAMRHLPFVEDASQTDASSLITISPN